MSERELHLALPAHAQNVIVVRQAVAGLGEALEMPTERVNDLKTVITEASNNVVLHAYEEDEGGPLEVDAQTSDGVLEIAVQDRGRGFQPSSGGVGDHLTLGLGLPLIASLSDSFEIRGGSGEGTRMTMRFQLDAAAGGDPNGAHVPEIGEELALQLSGGAMVRPVLARVFGALAARAEFSVERLEDTVLLGDAVSAHEGDDFLCGLVELAITDGDGMLDVRIGPLVRGGGQRILAEMELPGGGGSLRRLAQSMEVTTGTAPDGREAEYLVIEVSSGP